MNKLRTRLEKEKTIFERENATKKNSEIRADKSSIVCH